MMTKASRKRELSIRHGSLPVMVTTARTEPSLEEKPMSSHAICFLRKSFETEPPVNCLERVLGA